MGIHDSFLPCFPGEGGMVRVDGIDRGFMLELKRNACAKVNVFCQEHSERRLISGLDQLCKGLPGNGLGSCVSIGKTAGNRLGRS
jgi:hypothetical protein